MAWDAEAVRSALGLGAEHADWLAALEAVGPAPEPLRLPSPDDAYALLRELTVDEADAREVADTLPNPEADPALWWLLERSHHLMVRHLGDFEAELRWPALPGALGARSRLFLVYLFLATYEDAARWHRDHGVDPAASRGTFQSLGRAMRIHRSLHGTAGVFEPSWMTLPFRACLFELGRLQYTPFRLTPEGRLDAALLARLGPDLAPGQPTVGIHIPASGPLWPEAVDASLAWARELFSQPEPWGPCRVAFCGSWLLDEQWAEYLPAEANILRFQRRFHMLPGAHDADGSMFSHVFRLPRTDDWDRLPQRTTLERAIVAHWRKGRHWRSRTGWLYL